MLAKLGFLGPLFLVVLLLQLPQETDSQFDNIDIAGTLKSMELKDKIVFLSDFLFRHKELFNQLENILVAAMPILSFDHPPGWLMNAVLPWALDNLPYLLKNEEFLGIVKIFVTELDNHQMEKDWMLPRGTPTERRNYFVKRLFAVLDYSGMLGDILTYRSVRNFFPYSSTSRPLSEKCYNDTMSFFDRLLAGDTWAFDMFDAVGKPTTGIRRGVMYFIGTYDQCMAVGAHIPVNTSLGELRADTDQQFQGRYCRATFNPPKSLLAGIAGEHVNHTFGIPLTLSWGMCLPDSCHGADIEGLLNLGLLGSWFNISVADSVCTEDDNFQEDKNAHLVIGILSVFVILVCISSTIELVCMTRKTALPGSKYSVYDMHKLANTYSNGAYEEPIDPQTETETKIDSTKKPGQNGQNGRIGINGDAIKDRTEHKHDTTLDSDMTDAKLDIEEDEEGAVTKLLRSFSIFTNMPALVSTETKLDDVSCLYGIRFISMLFIMLGNTYMYVGLSLSEVPVAVNMMDSFDVMKRFTFQPILSATLDTDTFFMISGCLAAYWFLHRVHSKNNMVNVVLWLKFYAGKYWKLTPPYMLVMITFVYLYSYLGHGPVWPEQIQVAEACRTDWWKHLLYINNLVGVDGVPATDQCMAWSWYLAVNMQFYLITPILLSFTLFSPSLGVLLIGILAAAGIVSAGVKEASIGGDLLTTRTDNGAYWNNVFIAPWCRVAAYCVGLCLGIVLRKSRKQIPKILAGVLWLLAVCLGVLLIYCQYTKFVDGAEPWTSAQQAAYEALSRPVWALCVAWIVYACHNNLAGPVGEFFSWPGFVPLSRLTFMVYLLHPVLMVLVVYSKRALIHIDDFDMAYLFVGHVTINYAAAFFASLAFDLPFRNIKRILQGKQLDTPF